MSDNPEAFLRGRGAGEGAVPGGCASYRGCYAASAGATPKTNFGVQPTRKTIPEKQAGRLTEASGGPAGRGDGLPFSECLRYVARRPGSTSLG